MSIQTLYERIKPSIQEGALALTSDALQNEDITTLLTDYLNSATMQIGLQIEPIVTEDSLTITGTFLEGVFANIAVTVVLTEVDDVTQIEVTIQPTEDWSIMQYLTDLQGTPIEELDIVEPTLILRSSGDEKGLQFIATLNFTGPLESVGTLLGDVSSLSLDGTVTKSAEGYGIDFQASYEGELDLSAMSIIDLSVAIVAGTGISTEISLEGSVAFDNDGQDILIPLSAEIVSGESMIFTAQLSQSDDEAEGEAVDTSLDALSGLLSVSYLDAVLPESLDIGNAVALHDLIIEVDLSGPTSKITSITSGVQAAKPWVIAGDAVTVDTLIITFRVDDPSGTKELTAKLHGVIAIT